jgi:hypothetical protein
MRTMVNRQTIAAPLALISAPLLLTGCELAKGIFKAGVWVGVLGVVGVVLLAIFGLRALMR